MDTTDLTAAPLFALGRVVMTQTISESGLSAAQLAVLVRRHALGLWDLGEEDTARNYAAIEHGGRVVGAFAVELAGRVWLITEADRSSTCILAPEDY